jgi:hypothetical protein
MRSSFDTAGSSELGHSDSARLRVYCPCNLNGGLLLLLSVATIFLLRRAVMSDKDPFESESPTYA